MGVLVICPAQGVFAANDSLETCISFYKNGEYEKAIDCLTLLKSQAPQASNAILIFKYLGFSYGMLGGIDQAKISFSNVLALAPGMNLDTLECPPNINIIFNQVKLEREIAQISSTPPPKTVGGDVVQKKSPVVPVTLFALAVVSAGAGGYYYYSGNTFHEKYRALDVPDQSLMDQYYNKYKNASIKSAVFLSLSAVLLPVSTYLFLRKPTVGKHISFSDINGYMSLSYSF